MFEIFPDISLDLLFFNSSRKGKDTFHKRSCSQIQFFSCFFFLLESERNKTGVKEILNILPQQQKFKL